MAKVVILGGCGYIGSALRGHLDARGDDVASVDLERRGNPMKKTNLKRDYLDHAYLQAFDCVVLLAAHASAGESIADPVGTITNNILGFWELLEKLGDSQALIYASSGSVYDGYRDKFPDETAPVSNPRNMYDLSKMTDDFMASFSAKRTVGLRLATVCGASPNLREELIVNKMTLDALRKGVITISNPSVNRPCLGIGDLCRAVAALIDDEEGHVGIYNVASFTGTVEEIATAIATRTGARIDYCPDTPTYDFSMSAHRIAVDLGFAFSDSLVSVVEELVGQFPTVS